MPQTSVPPPKPPQAAKPKPPEPPPEFQEGDLAKLDAAKLLGILKDSASSEFKKSKACVRLGELGAKEAVPALVALLADEHLSVYARYGLEPIADPSVDDALRAAMAKLKGVQQIGVVNSIAKRRDAKAAPALTKMMYGADAELARAAASALGNIGGVSSAQELQTALGKTTGMTRMAVADAMLICAERLIEAGNRDRAMALYATVSASGMPQTQRLAAMAGIIREETSVARPR